MHCGHNRGKCDLPIIVLSTLSLAPLDQTMYIEGVEARTIIDSVVAVFILCCNEKGTLRDQHKHYSQFRVVVANSATQTIIGQKTVSITNDVVAVRHEFLLSPDTKWPAKVGCE